MYLLAPRNPFPTRTSYSAFGTSSGIDNCAAGKLSAEDCSNVIYARSMHHDIEWLTTVPLCNVQVLNAAFSWKDGHAARAVRLAPFIDATPAECEVCLQREQVPSTHDHMKHVSTGQTVEDSLSGECVIEYPVFVVQLQRQNTPGIAVKPAPQYKQPPPKAEASGNAT